MFEISEECEDDGEVHCDGLAMFASEAHVRKGQLACLFAPTATWF